MKKFKIVLISLILATSYSFAFAIEKNPTKINFEQQIEKELNQKVKQDEKEEKKNQSSNNLKTIYVKKDEIENFEFTNFEKETIKKAFNLDDANIYIVLRPIELEVKKFLTKKLDFTKKIKNYSVNLHFSKEFIIDSNYNVNVNSLFYLDFKTTNINKFENKASFLITITNPFLLYFKDIVLNERKIIKN